MQFAEVPDPQALIYQYCCKDIRKMCQALKTFCKTGCPEGQCIVYGLAANIKGFSPLEIEVCPVKWSIHYMQAVAEERRIAEKAGGINRQDFNAMIKRLDIIRDGVLKANKYVQMLKSHIEAHNK